MSTVLLIDDEPEMASLISMSLEGIGARVVHVTRLTEAVEAARAERPDAILLDIALGYEDGLKMLPRLREDPALAGVPIVVCSVHESRRQEAMSLGADGFVARPFRTSDLRSVLQPYLP